MQNARLGLNKLNKLLELGLDTWGKYLMTCWDQP